jgi:hypothetical protein
VKPKYKGKPTLLKWLTGSARTFRGPVVLGIRDISRTLEFRASYTLVGHAPTDSIELEIKPYALSEIEKVRAAFEGRLFESLLELLGTSEAQTVIGVDDDQSSRARSFAQFTLSGRARFFATLRMTANGLRITAWKYTGIEHTIVEAVLKADPTGYMLKHPWIHSQLDRLLALSLLGNLWPWSTWCSAPSTCTTSSSPSTS